MLAGVDISSTCSWCHVGTEAHDVNWICQTSNGVLGAFQQQLERVNGFILFVWLGSLHRVDSCLDPY